MLPLELSLNALFDRFIVISGIIVLIVAFIRMFKAGGDKNWPEAIGHFVVVFVLFGFLSASTAAVAIVNGMWHLLAGG